MNKGRWLTWLRIVLTVLGVHYGMMALALILLEGSFSFDALGRMIRERLMAPGDAVRYLDIAQNGYVRSGENAINLVFYPLYPFLMRVFSFLSGDMALTGVILSQACYGAAAIVLYELICLDGNKKDGWLGVMLLTLYPFSMFAMGVFTEGLFLLLTLGCLYALRRGNFLAAGIVGFLAALCRTQGVLLFIPAVYEWITGRFSGEKSKAKWTDAGILLIPLGLAVYLLINYVLHGNPLKFLEFEAGEPWYQTSEWISRNIALQWQLAHEYDGLQWVIYYPQVALYFAALGVLFFGIKQKTRISFVLYGGAYLGFTYLSGWMISGGRYMLCCVPLLMILSRIQRERARQSLLLLFTLLFFAYSLFYLAGFAIM